MQNYFLKLSILMLKITGITFMDHSNHSNIRDTLGGQDSGPKWHTGKGEGHVHSLERNLTKKRVFFVKMSRQTGLGWEGNDKIESYM